MLHIRDVVRFAREVTSHDILCLRSSYLNRLHGLYDDDKEQLLLPLRISLLKRDFILTVVDVSRVYDVVRQKLGRLIYAQSVSLRDRWNGLCGYIDNTLDGPTIVYNKDLNLCWRRFTIVKELMHLYSYSAENLRHPDLDRSMALTIMNEAIQSRQIQFANAESLSDEAAAIVMAIEVLLPWRSRNLLEEMIRQKIDPFLIAKAFMIPLSFVKIYLPNGYCDEAGGYCNLSRTININLEGDDRG